MAIGSDRQAMVDDRWAAGRRGFSLPQLAAAVAVIVVLALVVPATIAHLVSHSRVARAQAEVAVIAEAIRSFTRDTGFAPACSRSPDGGQGAPGDHLDLLVGPGEVPRLPLVTPWSRGRTDTLANQLVANTPGYRPFAATPGRGWRGPYLMRDIGADPWNNRYMVNIGLAMTEFSPGSGPARAVWVLSAGPNGVSDTPFDQPSAQATLGGDDIGARVR